jgi:phosphoserine phosphatase
MLEMKIVVDLDGTLSRANTFHRWTVATFLAPNPMHRNSLAVYLKCVWTFFATYGMRACRILSHHQMKGLLIAEFGRLAAELPVQQVERQLSTFANTIVARHLNSDVKAAIDRISHEAAEGPDAVALATAAPSLYANSVAEQLGFRCFATEIPLEGLRENPQMEWEDNRRAAKLQSVSLWLGSSPFVLFTDHVDDWPLIERAESVFLVNPSRQLVSRVKLLPKSYQLLT